MERKRFYFANSRNERRYVELDLDSHVWTRFLIAKAFMMNEGFHFAYAVFV